MATKYTGNYTNNAAKVIKQSSRLVCQVSEDGAIYVCNSYAIYKMDPLEYAAIVQPVVCCDAGDWEIDSTGKKPRTVNVAELFDRTIKAAANAATLDACPLVFPSDRKTEIVGYYCAATDFAAIYNRLYMGVISPSAEFKCVNAVSAAVAYAAGEPFAMVLPISPKSHERILRSIKAYFVGSCDDAEKNEKAATIKLREMISAYESDLEDAKSEINALREQLAKQAEELESRKEEKPTPEAQVEEKETAESIAARFAEIPGITVNVKGAHTSAPVIWLSGEVQQNAEAIKAAGARWSAKRSAYYFRVA